MAKPPSAPTEEDDDFAQLAHQWSQITAGVRALLRETKSGVFYLLTSRTFQKSLISSILILTASVILYIVAAVAYVAFYYAYLPKLVQEQEVYLHYGYGQNPLALTPITLLPSQPYDISVTLTLPLTPENTKRGNFMVVVHLLDIDLTDPDLPSGASSSQMFQSRTLYNPSVLIDKATGQSDFVTSLSLADNLKPSNILLTSARPAIIPYTDPLVSLAKRILFLPYHVLFTQRAEATTLSLKMLEKVVFGGRERSWMMTAATKGGERGGGGAGGKVPKSMVVEIQAGQGLQVYECRVSLVAQLRGLRWLMYRWRVLSFVVITGLFWGVEMGVLGVTVVVVGGWLESTNQTEGRKLIGDDWEQDRVARQRGEVKEEGEEMSDTERTFPTGRGEMPLRYESSSGIEGKGIKKEEGEGGGDGLGILLTKIPDFGEQGDDEEDGEGSGWRDSGIGTSASYSDALKGGGDGGGPRRRRVSRP
ncbi:putative adipose-regulatory protein-domain-containing protein [Apiosordaria backusii]|uniref:Adipose-regulatory protein-domain-containing protein n=1 Tax=Apiosordaria backusii TaxID=314023 RepID=A0AA40K1J7_9PEZI|nr:putative adipose-regulatory protein-domain-containing protein [Apiosordaria backusii]